MEKARIHAGARRMDAATLRHTPPPKAAQMPPPSIDQVWPSQPPAPPAEGTLACWLWRTDVAVDSGPLADQDRRRAERFYRQADRVRFLASRGGLRLLLAAAVGGRPAEVRFAQGPQGKPTLPGPDTPHFNLSHAGDWAMAALATADAGEVGADLERHRPVSQADAIARRHFTPAELARRPQSPDEHPFREWFFGLWTAKEAVAKLLGTGLATPLEQIETPPAPPPPRSPSLAGLMPGGWAALPPGNPLGALRCWVQRLPPPPGYSAAVATLGPPAATTLARLRP